MALVFISQVFLLSAHHVLFQGNHFCTTHPSHSNPHIYVPKGRAVHLKAGTRGQKYAFKIDLRPSRKTRENHTHHFLKSANVTFRTPGHTTSEKFKTHRGAMLDVGTTTTRERKKDTHNLMAQVTIPTCLQLPFRIASHSDIRCCIYSLKQSTLCARGYKNNTCATLQKQVYMYDTVSKGTENGDTDQNPRLHMPHGSQREMSRTPHQTSVEYKKYIQQRPMTLLVLTIKGLLSSYLERPENANEIPT